MAFVPPDGGYGWIIITATTLINISVLPLVQFFGIIYAEDFKKLNVTAAQTSFLLHLQSAIYCSLGLLGSPLLKKYDFRKVALLGTGIMTFGIFLTSFTKSYGVLIVTFSVLVGVGQGIMLPATYLATNTYFKKRLTLAVSFSVTGASISSIIMPQVCSKLLKIFKDTQGTVLILAAISLIGFMCCFLLKPIRKPKIPEEPDEGKTTELELLNEEETVYKSTTRPATKKSFFGRMYELFDLELLNDRCYVVTILGMSVSFASELNVILMLAFILPELAGFKVEDVALALSVQSIADITGRLGVPLLGHFLGMPPRGMYAFALITSTIGRTVMSVFYTSKWTILGCVSLIGLAKGIKAVYQSVIIPKLVPLEKLPAANGLNMLLTGVSSLVVGTIVGGLHDVSGTYIYTLHAGSLLSTSCVILWLLHYLIFERKMNNNSNTINKTVS